MAEQIPLPLLLNDEYTLDNYYSIGNEVPLKTLHKTAMGRGEKLIYLWGSSGTGKSHLLHGCAGIANELKLQAFYISLKDTQNLSPDILKNLENQHLICLDDLQGIAKCSVWEETVFACFNRIQESGKRLIMAATLPPNQLELQLKDLTSRFQSAVVFHLHELPETEKLKALIYRAQCKGLLLPYEVARFLMLRSNRDMPTLMNLLNQIDRAALQENHSITIPFVKSVLKL